VVAEVANDVAQVDVSALPIQLMTIPRSSGSHGNRSTESESRMEAEAAKSTDGGTSNRRGGIAGIPGKRWISWLERARLGNQKSSLALANRELELRNAE